RETREIALFEKEIIAASRQVLGHVLTHPRPQSPVLQKDGLDIVLGARLILADIVLKSVWADGNRLAKIYRDIVPLNSDQQPRAALLDPGLGSTLFTDDIGITELLVPCDSVVKHRCIAVQAHDVVAWINQALIRSGRLPVVLHQLGLSNQGSIVGAE